VPFEVLASIIHDEPAEGTLNCMADWINDVLIPGVQASIAAPRTGNWIYPLVVNWEARIDAAVAAGELDESARDQASQQIRTAVRAVSGVTVQTLHLPSESSAPEVGEPN
jgi:hypothetical protein